MKTQMISKHYNFSALISASLAISIFFLMRSQIEGALPEIILGISLLIACLQQTLIYRPIARSISERNEDLKHAKREAEKIAQFPINNPHPLIQIAFDGDIIFANPAAYEHYPDLAEQKIKHPVAGDLDDFMDTAKANPDEKHITVREMDYGEHVYQQTITSVVTNGRLALVIYCYDITAIKEAQHEARLLGAAMEVAKDGVIITKANLDNPEIIYVNEAISKISGYSADELIGQTPRILQGPMTCRETLNRLKNALSQGKAFQGELQNYSKDGNIYWLDISIVPVKDENGHITHFAGIERDITQRKIFEMQLQVTKDAAETANKAKGDFLANMSHELRTPMNGIIGLSELLMEMDIASEQNELAEAINSSSRNLLILLNDILDLSKIEAGELTFEHIPFDPRRAVRQTVDLLKPIASKKRIVLENTINPIVPEKLMGDPSRVQQIMNNLISNAIKFTEVGYVRVDITSTGLQTGDPELHIRVEDTGIGIPDHKQKEVFQKFTQADVSTARKYGGTGLGLSITQELVEMMGGTIGFDSEEGKGTTFYVRLPIEIAEHDIEDTDAVSTAAPINTGAKVMVVDDHPVNLLFMRKVLKKIGFGDVDEATCGREAIELAEQHEYDLIFMDCQMPEIDGFEASTIIREREKEVGEIKIIAVTADAMKGARERCINAGMNDYISKPVDTEKLRAVLGEWVPGDVSKAGRNKNKVARMVEETMHADIVAAPVSSDVMDWERLRMFTDGDPQEEKALIDMFITYAEESLEVLCNFANVDNEDWQKAAHKLKGSAANLGAKALSHACLEAEHNFDCDDTYREEMLNNILASYEEVKNALHAESVSA